MRFQTDWASLILGSKFTVFALFYFVFESNFPSTSPPPRGGGGGEACIWKGDLTEVFFCVSGLGGFHSEGLIFGILRYAKNEHRPCWGRGRGSKQLKKKLLCMHFLQRSTI